MEKVEKIVTQCDLFSLNIQIIASFLDSYDNRTKI